jgi:hypothetical protein
MRFFYRIVFCLRADKSEHLKPASIVVLMPHLIDIHK